MKKILVLLFFISIKSLAQNELVQSNKEIFLPANLTEGRFFLKIPTLHGDTVLGFCDTGGGFTAIYNSTIKLLGLESKVKLMDIDGDTTKYIAANEIYSNQNIPYPQIANYYKTHIDVPFLEVPADRLENDLFSKYVNHQIFLGQFFFINDAWTFNYQTGQLSVNTPVSPDLNNKNILPLGFKKDKKGIKKFGHPSLALEIDGKIVYFLFDTGATFLLSDSGSNELGIETKATAGSFIAKSLFDKWHLQHPEWRIIVKGEMNGADLIEVPNVKVGDLSAGPVWFSKRPDEAWSKGMIGSMDRVVQGAIGGSFMKYFKVTIDYNSELVKFEK